MIFSASAFLAERIFQLVVSSAAILDPLSILSIVFGVSMFLYLLYFICRSLVGWRYYEILLAEVDAQYDKLVEDYGKQHIRNGKQKVESMINEAFDKKLIKWLVECTAHNQDINKLRLVYMTKYFDALPFYLFALSWLYILFYIR